MKILTEKYELNQITQSLEKYFQTNTLFFDIECTGLSPKTAFIYLIGCAKRTKTTIETIQFFAEDYDDEKTILQEFNNYLLSFDNLLGFNSTRFDQPFLLERFKKYGIETKMSKMNHKDLYLTVTKAKCLLTLNNYKQKTIEQFLGLYREDRYNGGELIPIYQEYVSTHNEDLLKLLLLHNLEDVKGMVTAIDILSYVDLLNADITIENFKFDSDQVRYISKTSITIPISINKTRDYGMYIIKNNNISGILHLYSGTLNTYLNDYKNYYYLLNEDIIIPKVLGASIDKSNKRQAKKEDCKVSYSSTFIQIPNNIVLPQNVRIFKMDFSSNVSFIEQSDLTDEILINIIKFQLKH